MKDFHEAMYSSYQDKKSLERTGRTFRQRLPEYELVINGELEEESTILKTAPKAELVQLRFSPKSNHLQAFDVDSFSPSEHVLAQTIHSSLEKSRVAA